MLTRRNMFGFLGVAGAGVASPLAMAAGPVLFDPGRRVTHLPGGGLLIEDQKFDSGISVEGCNDLHIQNCSITVGTPNGVGMKLLDHRPIDDNDGDDEYYDEYDSDVA